MLSLLAGNKSLAYKHFTDPQSYPRIFVLMSAYNEESVLKSKITSVMDSDYPQEKLYFLIGSDHSSDNTDDVLQVQAAKYDQLYAFLYEIRKGKANVLNQLVEEAKQQFGLNEQDLVVFTDANVLFKRQTLVELSKYFAEPEMGMVGANIVNTLADTTDIALQEEFYIRRENKIKFAEGKLFGCMMGAFGACYAVRAALIKPFPSNFLMEDFYLSMHILQQNKKAILNLDAICLEDLPGDIEEEFRRKRRISAGNYQNLFAYLGMLFRPFRISTYVYWSHKVLRWLTPFMLLAILVLNIFLLGWNQYMLYLLITQIAFYLSPLPDFLLKKAGLHLLPLRFISYFIMMNLALVSGLFMYIKGIKNNAWQPTKRK
jgi:cellulose synthase/poly-beta-1,6-N-acetylglucosamine synthase-like glycosyltransferase